VPDLAEREQVAGAISLLAAAFLFLFLFFWGHTSIVGMYYRLRLRRSFYHERAQLTRFSDVPLEAPYILCNTTLSGHLTLPGPGRPTTASSFVISPILYGSPAVRFHYSTTVRKGCVSACDDCHRAIASPLLVDGMGASGAAIGTNVGVYEINPLGRFALQLHNAEYARGLSFASALSSVR
jgi:hypothetical protein